MSTIAQVQAKSAPAPSFTPVRTNLLQRKCACGGTPGPDGECAQCRKKRLQRRSTGQAEPSTVPPIIHDVLRSSGQPLDPAIRAFMEPRFGHDFSQVRVHTDALASESAQAVNALAYTVGRDVVFGAGQYATGTGKGRRLLAHELTHVVQQSAVAGLGVQRADAEEEKKEPATNTSAKLTPDAGATPTKTEGEQPASDAAIDALDLALTAKEAAQELKKKRPEIAFTSGRRNKAEQARAMASNIVSSKDRKWIEKTYSSAAELQKWVDDNPKAVTVDDIAAGLEKTMDTMSESELGKVSKHLSGEAFDVQPQEKDADAIKNDIKVLPGLSKFLEKEGGLVRWHAQFKSAGNVQPEHDRYEQEADLIAHRVVSGKSAGSVSNTVVAPLQRQTVPEPEGTRRRAGQTLPYREAMEEMARDRLSGGDTAQERGEEEAPESAKEGSKKVCLTYDDGPQKGTEDVLDAHSSAIPATFFLTGKNMQSDLTTQKRLVERMLNEGHQIGNHTFTHDPATTKGYEKAYGDLSDPAKLKTFQDNYEKNEQHFRDLLGSTSPVFELARLPGNGRFVKANGKLIFVVATEDMGMAHVTWHFEFGTNGSFGHLKALDWKGIKGVAAEANRFPNPSDVVLLHDRHWSGKQALLKEIFGKLAATGFTFGKLDASGKCG